MDSPERIGRRRFLAAAGAGTAVTFGIPGLVAAAEWSDTEKANAKVVTDMCAVWTAPIDFDKIGRFLAEDCTFRLSETAAPIKGRQAIVDALRKSLGESQKVSFEIVQTFARGPMVVNERIDRFTLPARSIDWNGVGVFFLRNGLIQEWSDYTVRRG
jgi:limonene-1,2-epoxide hydrolase